MLTEGRAERPGLRPPSVVQIALGRAVTDFEAGRIPVPGRSVPMADERDMTAIDEGGPGLPCIVAGRRRGDQRNGKCDEREPGRTPTAQRSSQAAINRPP